MELPFVWLRAILREPNSEEVMALISLIFLPEKLPFPFG